MYLKQTMLLGDVVSQLLCTYNLCYMKYFYVIFFSTCLNTCAVSNMAVVDYYYYYYYRYHHHHLLYALSCIFRRWDWGGGGGLEGGD